MKIHFSLPSGNSYHQYCLYCYHETITRVIHDGRTYYHCTNCNQEHERSLVIDPTVVWWIDENTQEYWHESVGIFVINTKDQILLFERTIFPFCHTIPAGHLDAGEKPDTAIRRELHEETGITDLDISLFVTEDVLGDSCRRGSDAHRWHLYTTRIATDCTVAIQEEGINPIWVSIDEALTKDLSMPTRYFLEKYSAKILAKK